MGMSCRSGLHTEGNMAVSAFFLPRAPFSRSATELCTHTGDIAAGHAGTCSYLSVGSQS